MRLVCAEITLLRGMTAWRLLAPWVMFLIFFSKNVSGVFYSASVYTYHQRSKLISSGIHTSIRFFIGVVFLESTATARTAEMRNSPATPPRGWLLAPAFFRGGGGSSRVVFCFATFREHNVVGGYI